MKRLILFFILMVLVAACGTHKKVQQSEEKHEIDSSVVKDVSHDVTSKVVDTTKTEQGTVIITEIDFDQSDTASTGNNIVDVGGVGVISGSIKHVRQTIIEETKTEQGKSEERAETKKIKKDSAIKKKDSHKVKDVQPTGDPYEWRYRFYVIATLVAVAIFIYIKRKPFLEWLRKILKKIKLIFK